MINNTINYDEYFDTPFYDTYRMRSLASYLNMKISIYTHNSHTRPSKQSRKDASYRAAYYVKQRNALLNLYPEYFL